MSNIPGLENSLLKLISSRYPKTQLDILWNGQVVLQVFNQSDVKKWNYQMPLNEEGGIVLNLFFHKTKRNNQDNHIRFKGLDIFDQFILRKMDKGRLMAFYLPISIMANTVKMSETISNLLFDVYGIDFKSPLEFYVRSFS